MFAECWLLHQRWDGPGGIEGTRLAGPTETPVQLAGATRVYVADGISVFIVMCLESWKLHFIASKRKAAESIPRRCFDFRTRATGRDSRQKRVSLWLGLSGYIITALGDSPSLCFSTWMQHVCTLNFKSLILGITV